MMLKKRLIACLLWRDGAIVQSVNFNHTNIVGSALTAVDYFHIWGVDEIILLNVSRTEESKDEFLTVLGELSKRCFVPLSVGGWVRSLSDIRDCLNLGADKITVNTPLHDDTEFVSNAVDRFGSQCVVASIDVRGSDGSYQVWTDRGTADTGRYVEEWARRAEAIGVGEIFLTSIDRDGTQSGYDLELLRLVSGEVTVPVIASGGAGGWNHLVDAIRCADISGVSVANKLHHTQHSTKKAKDHMISAGIDVRRPVFD
jgi:cyclase